MNRDEDIAKLLEGCLSTEDEAALAQDAGVQPELKKQIALDAALKVLLEDKKVTAGLGESILASLKAAPVSRLEQDILAATLGAAKRGKGGRIRRAAPVWAVLPRWTTAAAAVFMGGMAGSLLWPEAVLRLELGPVIVQRTGEPFLLHGVLVAGLPAPVPVLPPEAAPEMPAPPVQEMVLPKASVAAAPPPTVLAEVPHAPVPVPKEVAESSPPPPAMPQPVPEAAVLEAKLPVPMRLTSKPGPEVPADAALTSLQRVDFERHVLPILQRSCFECHSGKLKKPKGGIRLDDLAAIREKSRTDNLLFPHKPDRSTLVRSLTLPADHEEAMPPKDESTPLTSEEKGLIHRWVEEGADFGEWTSERAKEVQISTQNEAVDTAQVQATARRIDELLRQDLARHGQEPRALAAESTWLRRVYLDLVGRIPTSPEASRFLKDKQADKRARLVDELLASNGHVSHMFNYWSGLLRARDELAEGVKGDFYLAWIKQSVRDNKPYDQWARELISPEGYGWRAPAAGYYLRDGVNRAANIESTATLFLGTQISCAQCHDHPYDRWTRKDYHQFMAWTSGIQTATEETSVGQVEAKAVQEAAERYDRMAMNRADPERRARYERVSDAIQALQKAAGGTGVTNGEGSPALLPEDYQYSDGKPGEALPAAVLYGETPKGQTRAADTLAAWVTAPDNARFSLTLANRLWERLFGQPFAGPVDHVREVADCDNPDLAQYLVHVVRQSRYDVRQILRILCLTQAYQQEAGLPVEDPTVAYRFPGPVVRRLSAEQVWDSMMALAVDDLDVKLNFDPPEVAKLEAAAAAKKTSEVTQVAKQMAGEEEREMKAEQRRARLRGDMAQEFAGGGLERASELPQPTPDGHFLRMFGQGSRDFIGDAWSASTVPQALLMLNSDFFDHVARSGSPLSDSLRASSNARDVARSAFMTVLTREPTAAELDDCLDILGETRNAKTLARTLLSTAEFVFQK